MALSLDPLRPYTRAIAAVLLAAVVVGWAWYWYARGATKWEGKYDTERAAHAATKKANADVLTQLATATAQVAAKASAASSALARDRTDNDNRYQEKVNEAQQARSDLAAALRRGDVQLQPWWECGDSTAASASDAADAARRQDVAAELRAADTAATVEDADRADAWIGWLQDELTSTRTRVIGAGCAVEATP